MKAGMSKFSMRSFPAGHKLKSSRLEINNQLADFACHDRRDSSPETDLLSATKFADAAEFSSPVTCFHVEALAERGPKWDLSDL